MSAVPAETPPIASPEADPQRRFLDQSPVETQRATPTLVGQGSHFDGELRCQGDLTVSGSAKGIAHIAGTLLLTDTGYWQGELYAQHAIIAGHLTGQLRVSGKLEVRSSARIQGEIIAAQIAIAEGAIIEGSMQVSSAQPVQRFIEKRKK